MSEDKKPDWQDEPKRGRRKMAGLANAAEYDPDEMVESLTAPVKNPILALIEQLKAGEAEIAEATIIEARVDELGRLMPQYLCEAGKPYRLVKVKGKEAFLAKLEQGKQAIAALPEKAQQAREAKALVLKTLREAGLREDFVDQTSIMDGITTHYDRAQFTEYTPIMGGPFYHQMYMFDQLRSIALAFEAYHHNPIAKRGADILVEYVIGRGFQVASKDQDYLEKVEAVIKDIAVRKKLPFWLLEFLVNGELILDNLRWLSIDSSTIWQIVHEPENADKIVYLYQNFPTDYQMFTGFKVPGAPDSDKTPPLTYIVRQIPASQVVMIKHNCVSNEVRGRSMFFPVHGWLKRLKDLLTAEVVRAQLEASFIFDDTIKGSDADVQAHLQQYSGMPMPGSLFAHNEAVERKTMAVMPQSATSAASGVYEAILCIIATCWGIPKEHLNVMGQGGSRATALVGSEPFTKVIEKLRVVFEDLIHRILEIELPRRGLAYDKDNIEIIFPSVVKDAASETIKNIQIGEAQGYISKRTAGKMYGAEMEITSYDYEAEQQQMTEDKAAGLEQVGDVPAPEGRTGDDSPMGSDITGEGRMELQDQLGNL